MPDGITVRSKIKPGVTRFAKGVKMCPFPVNGLLVRVPENCRLIAGERKRPLSKHYYNEILILD